MFEFILICMKYLFTILFLLSSFGFADDITDDQSVDPVPPPTFEEWGDGMDEIIAHPVKSGLDR